jgi:chromosome segregation ATPase
LRESGGGGFSAAYHPVVVEPDAMPTIEALEAERRRLKELERNLAAERDRIQESAAREIARLQAALRDAAERAGKRERELESTQRKLERKGQGRRLAVFGTTAAARDAFGREKEIARREQQVEERERLVAAAAAELEHETARLRRLGASLEVSRTGVEQVEGLAAGAAELEARRADLDRQVAELVEVERRSAELLAARAAELEARARALDEREQSPAPRSEVAAVPVVVPADLRPEQERVEAKARTLEEAEGRLAVTRTELAAREGAVQQAEERAAREHEELEARARELAAAEERSADAERRAAELDDRATLLAAREAELADALAALERRVGELAERRAELESERRRLAGRARRLADAERTAPVGASAVPAATFSAGIRGLSRRGSG